MINVSEERKAFYTKIYRQKYSPDGLWLAAVDSRSRIVLFSIADALSLQASTSAYRPYARTIELSNPVFSLETIGSVLLCGDNSGKLFAYSWSDLSIPSIFTESKPLFEGLAFENTLMPPECNEINSICALDSSKFVYGGGANNGIHLVDAEQPFKVISTFAGHNDYVNEIKSRSETDFLSSSEDGTVRCWDVRTKNCAHVLRVCEEQQIRREGCGKGVCALDVSESFVVCGGEVDLSIWHLSSLSLATIMRCERPPQMRHIVASMQKGRILTGGMSPCLYQFDFSGKYKLSVDTSALAIYSIETNIDGSREMSTTAGNSYLIDAYINLSYVSFSFNSSLAS